VKDMSFVFFMTLSGRILVVLLTMRGEFLRISMQCPGHFQAKRWAGKELCCWQSFIDVFSRKGREFESFPEDFPKNCTLVTLKSITRHVPRNSSYIAPFLSPHITVLQTISTPNHFASHHISHYFQNCTFFKIHSQHRKTHPKNYRSTFTNYPTKHSQERPRMSDGCLMYDDRVTVVP
jgi:hypothetical protein